MSGSKDDSINAIEDTDSLGSDIRSTAHERDSLKSETPRVMKAPKKRSHIFHIICLTLLMLVMALPGIANLPVIDRDEARYATASVQMAESGDLVSIRFQDEARNKKPAGAYWAQTAMIKLFADEGERKIWAQRLPSVLGALIAVLATYWAGIPMIGRRGSFIGAGVLALSGLLVFEAHMAKTDALLLATAALVFVSFAHLRQGGGRFFALLFWAAIGVGIMIKGPVVPALAVLTLLSLWIWERGEDGPSWMRGLWFWPGPILCLLIILPWSILIWQATEGQFFSDALGGDFGSKLIGAQEKHGGPPGYYLSLLSILFWPGTLFLLAGFAFAVRSVNGSKGSVNPVVRAMRLALCFALPYWAIIELVPTKLPNYLLPIFPALAIMTGGAVLTLLSVREFKVTRILSALLFIIAGLTIMGAALLGESVYGPASLWTYGWGALAVVLIFIAGGAVMFSKIKLGITMGVLSAVLISPIVYQVLLPSLSEVRLADRVVSEMRAQNIKLPREGGPSVLAPNFTEPSLVYHLGTEIRLGDQIKLDNRVREGTVIITDVARPDAMDFDTRVTEAGFCTTEFAKFDGMNYSRGDPVTLRLTRVSPCESEIETAE